MRFGGPHYSSYKVKFGPSSGNYTGSVVVSGSPVTVSDPQLSRGVPSYFAVVGVSGGVDGTPSNELSATPVDYTTVRNEDFVSNGQLVSGTYGGIDWGGSTDPTWRSYAPFRALSTRSLYIRVGSSSTGPISKTITLPARQVLHSVRLGRNADPNADPKVDPPDPTHNIATIDLSSSLGESTHIELTPSNAGQVFRTGWRQSTASTSTVTLTVTQYAGGVGNVVFDDFVYEGDSPAVDFVDYPVNNSVIRGWYEGIDWGTATPAWKSSQPFGGMSTTSAYIDSRSITAVSKTITLHSGKVLQSLRMGRNANMANASVDLVSSVSANPALRNLQVTAATPNGAVFPTGWRAATTGTSTVTITVTYAGMALNVAFDDFVYVDGDTTVSFEEYPAFEEYYTYSDYPNADRPINGTYAGLTWASTLDGSSTGNWRSFGPFGGFTSTSAYIDTASHNASNPFTLPAGKVVKSAMVGRNAGATDATFKFSSSVAGNSDKVCTVTAGAPQLCTTGWTQASTSPSTVTVVVGYVGGVYNVSMDDLVYGDP